MARQGNELDPIGVMGLAGRNGSDDSLIMSDRQCVEAMNVDWYRSAMGRKRGGATSVSLAGGTAFANGVVSFYRHVPGSDQTAAEGWAVDGSSQFHRLAGSAVWADPTVTDPIQSNPQEVIFQSFNGKLYIAYDSAHNRLHVWDPADNKVRRVGIDLPAVPTLGALVAGAVTDTRKYKVSWCVQVSGVTTKRGNLSTATGSQALAAQQVPVTRPAAPGEGETHWELWGASTSSSFGDYRLIATTAIATATVNDNTASIGSLTTVAPDPGANTPPPSCKYLAADDARVIMGGAWETSANAENAMSPKNSRVWWTSILGASDIGDDERVSNTGTINSYADLEEAITAISQPLQLVSAASSSLERGSFYVFSYSGQWKFVSTGQANAPYLKFKVSGGRGCIHHKSLVTAEDENGNPVIMWASSTGIMRISINGQQFCGEDIVDVWETINLDATIPCHAVFYPTLHQVWFYIATGSSLYPDTKLVFDCRLGKVVGVSGVRMGWSRADGESSKAYCSSLFSDSIGATMGRSLKPYIGYTGATQLWKCDTTDLSDNGTNFKAYIDTKSYAPWGLGRQGGINGDVMVVAHPSSGVSIGMTIYRNEGAQSTQSKADLTPKSDSTAESKVFAKFGGARLANSMTFRCRIGDAVAVAASWNLTALIVPVSYQGEK